MFLLKQRNLHSGFLRYINQVENARLEWVSQKLELAYPEHGGWEFLRADPISWIGNLLQSELSERILEERGGQPTAVQCGLSPPLPEYPPPPGVGGPFPPWPPGGKFGHYGPPRSAFIVLDQNRKPLLGAFLDGNVRLRPIVHNGTTIGYVGLRMPPKHFMDPLQLQFLRQQKSVLVSAALGLTFTVALFAIPLSRRLLRPIKALAGATHELASGKYSIRVPVTSSDELGQLVVLLTRWQ